MKPDSGITGSRIYPRIKNYDDSWFDQPNINVGLKNRSIKGGIITSLSQLIIFIVNTSSTVVLARVLLPSDFGIIAMVAAFAGFVGIFKDIGFSMGIIQKEKVTHDQVSILFWCNITLCFFISSLFIVLSPFIVSFYKESRLFPLIIAYAISIFISSLSVEHCAILSRRMEFNKIALANIISSVLAVIVSIIMAFTGFGYWSLVSLVFAQSLFYTLLIWHYCPWKPKLILWQKGIKSFLHFGAGISGFNIINYFSRNIDNVMIGKFLGATMLGFYSKAYQLMMLPLTKIKDPLVTVSIPALSSLLKHPDRYRNYYYRLIFIICFFSFPMTVFLGIFAKQLIAVVLGNQWMGSVAIFKLLSISALLQPVGSTMGLIFISTGQPGRFFRLGLITSSIIVISFVIGIHWGIMGLIIAYTIANYGLLIPSLLYCFKNTPIKLAAFCKEILLPAVHTTLLAVVLYMVRRLLYSYLNDFLLLIIAFAIAVPFYYYSWKIYNKGKTKIQDINELIRICVDKLKLMVS